MDFFYSPGFGGAGALLAAVIAYLAAARSTRQRRESERAALDEVVRRRQDDQRAEAIQRGWDRYVWLVDHASDLSPTLVIGLLGRISTAGAALGDADLVEFSQQYASELAASVQLDRYSTDDATGGDTGSDPERDAGEDPERDPRKEGWPS